MVQPLRMDLKMTLDLDEGARPQALSLPGYEQRQDRRKRFAGARTGLALVAGGVAPELGLGVKKGGPLASFMRSECARSPESKAPLFAADAILEDPGLPAAST